MTDYTDKLSEFGEEFQTKVIYSLSHDLKFLQKIHDILDANYFELDEHRWIVSKIIEYYRKYKKTITLDVFTISIKSMDNKTLKESIKKKLKSVYEVNANDIEYVKDQFDNFCKNQKLKDAIVKSVDLLKVGEYSEIKKLVNDAIQLGMSDDIGHDWVDAVDSRLSDIRSASPTYIKVIDGITSGGLSGGEIGVVMAGSGIGKTWALCQLGFNSVMNGNNVLHITLELSSDYVARRYDTILTRKPFNLLKDNPDILKKKLKEVNGKLLIRNFPTRSITTYALESFIERVIQFNKIDLIILDYADLLSSGKNNSSNSYETMGNIYEDLRRISGVLGIPIWTASQTNKQSLQQEVVGAESIADSYKKMMTADFVMSITRKDIDKVNNKAKVHIIKNRFGPDGMTYESLMDTGQGIFEVYDTTINSIDEVKKDDRKTLSEKFKSFASKNEVETMFE